MVIHSTNQFFSRCDHLYDRLRRLRNDASDFGVVDEVLHDLDTSIYFLSLILFDFCPGDCYGKKEDETAEG